MAPIYDTALHNSEVLIARKPRNYYITSIKPIHWQLRSIIGVSATGTVYYPAGYTNQELHELDPTTKKAETVAYLEFSPRCLVATKGWVCCGGELGEFVAIRPTRTGDHTPSTGRNSPAAGLGRSRSSARRSRHDNHNDEDNEDHDDDYDDEDFYNIDSGMACDTPLVTVPPRMTARSGKFGKERVNCVTVWTPSDFVPLYPGAYPFPVAALSNNDKTVTLVNLETAEPLDAMDFPDCMNRAVLSPDGRILASVSDDPYLYIHERVRRADAPSMDSTGWQHIGSDGSSEFDSNLWEDYEWRLMAKHHLRGQSKDDVSVHRGSFAACFSNTGRFLAIGTQYGIISVYDTTRLDERDTCLIACFTSSKPNKDEGAVREMTFCPGPYDLLAWSEDHGAAGVADIRDCFVSRQILSLTDSSSYSMHFVRQLDNDEIKHLWQRRQPEPEAEPDDLLATIEQRLAQEAAEPPEFISYNRNPFRRRRENQSSEQTTRERIQMYLGQRAMLRSRPSRIPAAPTMSGASASASGANSAANNSGSGSSSRARDQLDADAAMNDILGSLRSARNREISDPGLRFLETGSTGLLQAARRSAAIPTVENEEYGGGRFDIDDYNNLFNGTTEMTRRRIHRMQQQQQQADRKSVV